MKGNKLKGCLLAFSAAMLWGVSGACCQYLFVKRGITPEWLVTVRLLVPGLILLLSAAVRKDAGLWGIWKNKKDVAPLLLFSIFGMLAVQYTYFIAIKYSNAATATVLQYLGPVLIAVYYTFKLRRLPTVTEFIAIILAMAGTFLLVTHGRAGELSISRTALFWGLAAAVTLAYHSIQPVGLLNKYHSAVVIGWSMLIGGAAMGCVYPPWPVPGIWDGNAYLCTAFIVLLGSLVAFYAYLTAVKMIGAGTSSLLACAEPLSAAVIAVVWLNVPFGIYEWLGTAFILATILLLTLRAQPVVPV